MFGNAQLSLYMTLCFTLSRPRQIVPYSSFREKEARNVSAVLTTVFVVLKQEESNADLPVDVCPLYIYVCVCACMYMYIFSYTF